MKHIYLLIGLAMGFCNIYPQHSGCECTADEEQGIWLKEGLMGIEYRNPSEGFNGRQYFGGWTPGEVILYNGDVIRNIYLRYDKYMDELLWLRDGDFKAGILFKGDVAGFRLFDERNKLTATFIKKNITLPFTGSTDAFLQVLVSGDITLYAYRNSDVMTNEHTLVDNIRYLISNAGEEYFLTLRRKSLLEIPVIQRAEMKAILRTNRISIRNHEQELVRAISLYNLEHPGQLPGYSR